MNKIKTKKKIVIAFSVVMMFAFVGTCFAGTVGNWYVADRSGGWITNEIGEWYYCRYDTDPSFLDARRLAGGFFNKWEQSTWLEAQASLWDYPADTIAYYTVQGYDPSPYGPIPYDVGVQVYVRRVSGNEYDYYVFAYYNGYLTFLWHKRCWYPQDFNVKIERTGHMMTMSATISGETASWSFYTWGNFRSNGIREYYTNNFQDFGGVSEVYKHWETLSIT